MDHIGLIGKLIAEGFQGKIYSTLATRDLAQVMLADGLQIMRYEAKRRDVDPLWDDNHLQQAFSNWQTYEYHDRFTLTESQIQIEFSDAGHILGSAMAKITHDGQSILFTGDLGNSPSPLLVDTEPPTGIDYLVMEAVYGNRNHIDRINRQQQLGEIIKRSIARGGAIIIPSFSLERTQMLLYELNELVESGQLPEIPVYLDSPLAIKVLTVYEQHSAYFNQAARADIKSGDNIFDFPGLQISKTKEDSKAIKHTLGPKIIIAGSGMSHAGRVLFHELEYLDDATTTMLFVGYQAPGTVGRQLLEGNKQVRIMGRKIRARAAVESLLSYSSHKDKQHLHEFATIASQDGAKEIYVVLSEPKVAVEFSQKLIDDPQIAAKVITPELGQEIVLSL
jgi:metallo-beta-lactamase family protein